MLKYRASYFFTLLAACVFYLFYNGYLSFFTLAAVVVLPLISWMLTLLAVRKTSVEVDIKTPFASKNEDFILGIVFHNRSFFPIGQASLKFSCTNSLCGEKRNETFSMPVNSRAEQAAEFPMKSQYCGRITVELFKIKYYDYLGIFTVTKNRNVHGEIFILPKTQFLSAEIDTMANSAMESSTYSKFKPGDDPSEIFDIRPFRSGDRLHRIHWKLSSKLDELMVKEFSLPTDSSILLLTELMAPDMAALDTVVETLASLSHFLLENQIVHCAEWYDAAHAQFNETVIENDDDLSLLLRAVLSAQQYTGEPCALNCQSRLSETAQNYPHTIYITGQFTQAIAPLCDRPAGEKTTVLYCGAMDDSQQMLADSLNNMAVQIIKIQPDKIQETLSEISI